MIEATYDTFTSQPPIEEVDWIPKGGPSMDPTIVRMDEEAKGLHKMICYETKILPARCYFRGSDENRVLHVVVTRESLRKEPLRVPSPDHPAVAALEEEFGTLKGLEGTQGAVYEDGNQANDDETYAAYALFSKRRSADVSEEEYAQHLDKILYIPFDVEFVDEASLRG